MHVLKTFLISTATGFTFVLMSGCAVLPGNLEITQRDRQVYRDSLSGPMSQSSEVEFPVAILTAPPSNDKERQICAALDSSLTNLVGELSFFRLVERSNLGALQREANLASLKEDGLSDIEIPEADYLITAKIATAEMKNTILLKDSFEAVTTVDFRFYEKPTNRVVLTRHLEGKALRLAARGDGEEATALLGEAASEAARAFVTELGKAYAPPARVMETRGGGEVAKITMGTNYGLTKGAKIEFFEYVDNSDIVEGAEREPSPVGYGKVIEIMKGTSWVQVANHKNALVFRGHYARLASDQEKGFAETLGSALK